MIRLQARSALSDAAVDKLLGVRPDASFYDVMVGGLGTTGDVAIYQPDGAPLFILLREAIPEAIADAAEPHLRSLRGYKTDARPNYSGATSSPGIRSDGRVENTNRAAKVSSATLGAYDRSARRPYGRLCAWTEEHFSTKWPSVVALADAAATAYERASAPSFKESMSAAADVRSEWLLSPSSPWSTMTVNNDCAGAFHIDRGDAKRGLGALAVLRRGSWSGGALVFPKYKIAVDLQHRDLCLFSPHAVHGNVPLDYDASDECFRVSVVLYLRAGMHELGSPAEELERAKRLDRGLGFVDEEHAP